MNREVMSIEEAIKRNMEFMNITKNVYELEKLHGKTVNLMFDIASMNVYHEDVLENMHSEIHECYRKNLRRL
jgi:hypothetical protein